MRPEHHLVHILLLLLLLSMRRIHAAHHTACRVLLEKKFPKFSVRFEAYYFR